MVIKVQCLDRRWRVAHPKLRDPVEFENGSLAFDFADRMAQAYTQQSGKKSVVRVELLDACVEVACYG